MQRFAEKEEKLFPAALKYLQLDHVYGIESPLRRRRKVLFQHFRKTGGTSVVQAMKSITPDGPKMYPCERNGNPWRPATGSFNSTPEIVRYWQFNESDMATFSEHLDNLNVKFISQEWGCLPPEMLQSYCMVTMMREPYDRFKSEFFFKDNFSVATVRGGGALEAEDRKGTASEWQTNTLFWNRDNGTPFKVCVNRNNYYVRTLCGLSEQPDAELTAEHLREANRRLRMSEAIVILSNTFSHALPRRTG